LLNKIIMKETKEKKKSHQEKVAYYEWDENPKSKIESPWGTY